MISSRAVLILMAFMIFSSGCASIRSADYNAENLYAKFRTAYSECNATALKSKASLYYSAEGRGHRTTVTLWGDLSTPLRLDVRAGIGAYIAHILEDASGLTAFYPEQKTAYTHSSPTRGVHMLGLPFPFSLKDLAGLICGCYQSLIPATYSSVESVDENGSMLYFFKRGSISSITLTNQGIPIRISGRGKTGWDMELAAYEDDESGKMLPGRITVYSDNGDKAVLRIKTREPRAFHWPAESLEMKLPEGTQSIPLDQNGYVRVN